jgi:diguanylate cyclase (GGDEF)-like protein
MTVHPLTLSFNGLCSPLEVMYMEEAYFRSRKLVRGTICVAAILMAMFALLEIFILPPTLTYAFLVIHSISLILITFLILSAFLIDQKKFIQPALVISSTIGGGGLVLMMALGTPMMRSTYYAGLILGCILVFFVLRIRFLYATITGMALVVLYGGALNRLIILPEDTSFANLVFLITAYLVCAWAAYHLEHDSRRRFFLAYQLETEKKKASQMLTDMETRVGNRTRELSSANTRLMIEIAERQQAQQEYIHLATHDSLTDLPNRTLMRDRLPHALARARRNKENLAILFLDLDGFKAVNDAYSHANGDILLKQVANRLKACLRENDSVSRFGGDEFVILIEDVHQVSDLTEVAKKILAAIEQPFNIEVAEVFITTSIGISIYPDHGDKADLLLKNADIAMYRAKMLGKNGYQYFSESIAEKVTTRAALGAQLRQALDGGEFLLHYQPQVDLETGRIAGVEALIHWQHPEEGLLPPSRFIPFAEENGLIVPLGEWALRTACNQVNTWNSLGLLPIRMAINISGRQLKEPDFVDRVACILSETHVPPEQVELELMESVVFQYSGDDQTLLQRLKQRGVQLAVDDFGRGYSTLSHLARLPIDTLKLDKAFADNILGNSNDSVVAAGIINIAHQLGLRVVAEGVETHEQLLFYEKQGCNLVQGWLFSRDVEADQISGMLIHGLESPVSGT